MKKPSYTTERSSISGGQFFVQIVFVVVVAAVVASLGAKAAIPEIESKPLAGANSYWNQVASSSLLATTPATSSRPEPVPTQTLEKKAPTLQDFIGVNLEAMELHLYKDGVIEETFPILSKGRPGSRFETPSGSYEIGYRNDNHLSSIGDVYMPYSQQFFGNFFIHGWPYYPGGEPVEDGYSGGCIRLSTADAKTIFGQTERGTPIVVVGGTQPSGPTIETAVAPPRVGAASYLVADLGSGQVFAAKRAGEAFPIASLSKLMTAVVANETIAYNDPITVSQSAIDTYGFAGGLTAGEKLKLKDLYLPLLLESSNDAATAIAEHEGFNAFLRLMNHKALALDMETTRFSDPSGLSAENTSSSRDLFRLARYIYDKKRFILDLTASIQETIPQANSPELRNFTNNNPMVGRAGYRGGKNGYTDEARHTLLSVFDVSINNATHQVAIIVLGSESHVEDTRRLLAWLKQSS